MVCVHKPLDPLRPAGDTRVPKAVQEGDECRWPLVVSWRQPEELTGLEQRLTHSGEKLGLALLGGALLT
ncbi:hypothetical protein, partial [Bifidobacterium actinocoloniiforme]|uniref:hypothetical protein n=1 Tax=Bifidobacterium actinocoloniiforme TaxID=638619 RepID=UPI0019D3EADF